MASTGGSGQTDRNRDHGFHRSTVSFGCNQAWSYLVSGDAMEMAGDSIRNVLDHRTSDNLAYASATQLGVPLRPSATKRVRYASGPASGTARSGLGRFYYADRQDKPHMSR